MTATTDFKWAIQNGDLDRVKTLVENEGKDIISTSISLGRLPLHYAADYGQADVIEYLVSMGADINAQDSHGITPLLNAIFEGHADCVKLLLDKGASKDGKSPGGSSYFDCAETDEIKSLLK